LEVTVLNATYSYCLKLWGRELMELAQDPVK